MHELGIMIELVRQVERVALENGAARVEKIVLQIGEIAGVVPHFIRECYPAAVDQTLLEKAELEVELIPANGRCKGCGQVYGLRVAQGRCPACGDEAFELLCGREFILKEIVVSDERNDRAEQAQENGGNSDE